MTTEIVSLLFPLVFSPIIWKSQKCWMRAWSLMKAMIKFYFLRLHSFTSVVANLLTWFSSCLLKHGAECYWTGESFLSLHLNCSSLIVTVDLSRRLCVFKRSPKNWSCVNAQSLSCVRLFATLWTVARQAPLSLGFPRQEYWSGLPFPSPGDLSDPGIEPGSPFIVGRFFTVWTTRGAHVSVVFGIFNNLGFERHCFLL